MKRINTIKNIAIILDFIVSCIAVGIGKINPVLSGILFGISALILFVAVVCVVLEFIKSKK